MLRLVLGLAIVAATMHLPTGSAADATRELYLHPNGTLASTPPPADASWRNPPSRFEAGPATNSTLLRAGVLLVLDQRALLPQGSRAMLLLNQTVIGTASVGGGILRTNPAQTLVFSNPETTIAQGARLGLVLDTKGGLIPGVLDGVLGSGSIRGRLILRESELPVAAPAPSNPAQTQLPLANTSAAPATTPPGAPIVPQSDSAPPTTSPSHAAPSGTGAADPARASSWLAAAGALVVLAIATVASWGLVRIGRL